MSTKQEDSRSSDEIVTIPETNDQNKSGEHGKIIGHSKYRKYDEKKRYQVMLWGQLVVFLIGVGSCVASFSIPSLRNASPKGLATWQWCLLVTALLGGPILSQGVVHFIKLFIDREISAKENVIYYVVGLVESAWVTLYFSMVLLAWLWVVDEPRYLGVQQENKGKLKHKFPTTYHIIYITLITYLIGSFLRLLKDLIVMIAESSFHIRRFFVRIREAIMHQYLFETLSRELWSKSSTKKLGRFEKCKRAFQKIREGCDAKTVVDLSSLDDVTEDNVSCWGMKILIKEITERPLLTYKGNNGDQWIETEKEAIHVADAIFSAIASAPNTSSYISKEELLRYLKSEKEVSLVMKWILGRADANQIERDVFRKWMVKAFKHRSALVQALNDNKELFRKLNRFIHVVLIFLIFVLWLIMLKVETRKVIFFIGSAFIASAVIIGDFCKKLLDNFAFVFMVHPFDTGDCCLIDNTPVIIKEINIFTTVAFTFDNEMRHYPNTALSTNIITNYTRSPQMMGDSVVFYLDISTSVANIDKLTSQIESYIENNSQYWHPEHSLVMELEDMSKMKVTLQVQHTINYHEYRERQARKTMLTLEIRRLISDLK